MKEYKKLILEELLAKLKVAEFQTENNNNYVFGSDDCFRIIKNEIDKLR